MKPQSCAASAVGPSLPPGSAWFLAPAPGSCQLRFPAGRRQRPGQAEPSACSAPGARPSPSAERPVSTRFYPDCRLPDCSLETRYGRMAQVQTQISLGNTLPPWGGYFLCLPRYREKHKIHRAWKKGNLDFFIWAQIHHETAQTPSFPSSCIFLQISSGK